MAIRPILTRGYGNGTFNGTIPLVVLRGYTSSAAAAPPTSSVLLARLNKANSRSSVRLSQSAAIVEPDASRNSVTIA